MQGSRVLTEGNQSHVYVDRVPPGGPNDGANVEGIVAFINWQHTAEGRTGATIEDVLLACIQRLELANAKLPCQENIQALAFIGGAILELEQREKRRAQQGLTGTEVAHA